MKSFLKMGSIGTAAFSVAILSFLFVPYPWFQPETTLEEEVEAIEARGHQY